MSKYWKHRVAVVTGASRGIGARTAITLANNGLIVVGLARNVDDVTELNKEVTGEGKIYGRFCDLSKNESIIETFRFVREKFHVVHILVCNAGIIKANFIKESTTEELKELCDINIVATAACIREAMKIMTAVEVDGHIIVMNSVLGHRIPEVPVPLFSLYPATKHAITALCQTVRQEIHYLKLNIKLTSISPGLVDTEFLKVYSRAVDELPKLQPEDVAQAVLYALETPPHLQVEDIVLRAIRVNESTPQQ